jgi:hypothetical protein
MPQSNRFDGCAEPTRLQQLSRLAVQLTKVSFDGCAEPTRLQLAHVLTRDVQRQVSKAVQSRPDCNVNVPRQTVHR